MTCRIVRLALLALFLAAPLAGVETWYFVSAAGPDCTTGGTADDGLSTTAGSSNTSHDIATQQDLHYDEDRTITSGTWQVWVDINCGSGGGAGPRVNIDVLRVNSLSCGTLATLISCVDNDLTKGATVEITCTGTPGQQVFADGDYLVVRVVQSRGSVTCNAQFNNSTSGWDSRLDHPDEAAAGDELMVIGE